LLFNIALGTTSDISQNTPLNNPTSSGKAEFYIEINDPYDRSRVKARVIGKHIVKTKVLGVRLDSTSLQYPRLGREY